MTPQDNSAMTAPSAPANNELTPGQMLYQSSFDILPFKHPKHRYLIFSSQRTGSNYLCRRLCNTTGYFGLPSEYLHPKAIQMMASRLIPNSGQTGKIPLGMYLQNIEQARTTADGYFGIKVQPSQLLAVVGRQAQDVQRFVERFDRLVLMTRRDKLGQAVSGAIAQITGTWFNNGQEPALEDGRIIQLFPVIAHNLARYIDEERMILNIGRSIAKPLLRIDYEEIAENGSSVFMNLVDFLANGNSLDLNEELLAPIPEKPPGTFANLVRARFIAYINDQPSNPLPVAHAEGKAE